MAAILSEPQCVKVSSYMIAIWSTTMFQKISNELIVAQWHHKKWHLQIFGHRLQASMCKAGKQTKYSGYLLDEKKNVNVRTAAGAIGWCSSLFL